MWGRKKRNAACVGYITSRYDTGNKERLDAWVERCAAVARADEHTAEETERYFLSLCHAERVESPAQYDMFKAELIMNFFPEVLTIRPQPPRGRWGREPSRRQLCKWGEENHRQWEEARAYPAEQLGLNMHIYTLTAQGNPDLFAGYEERELEVTVKFEYRTGQVSVSSSERTPPDRDPQTPPVRDAGHPTSRLALELARYRGIGQADIDTRSPRFLGYISTMCDAGVPGYEREW